MVFFQILTIIALVLCFVIIFYQSAQLRILKSDYSKVNGYYRVLIKWLTRHLRGKRIEEYFVLNGYRTIAVYGVGELGIALIEYINMTSIVVAYAIDRNAENVYAATDIYRPDECLEAVDVVVVTTPNYYLDITRELEGKMQCPIVSIEDVIRAI